MSSSRPPGQPLSGWPFSSTSRTPPSRRDSISAGSDYVARGLACSSASAPTSGHHLGQSSRSLRGSTVTAHMTTKCWEDKTATPTSSPSGQYGCGRCSFLRRPGANQCNCHVKGASDIAQRLSHSQHRCPDTCTIVRRSQTIRVPSLPSTLPSRRMSTNSSHEDSSRMDMPSLRVKTSSARPPTQLGS